MRARPRTVHSSAIGRAGAITLVAAVGLSVLAGAPAQAVPVGADGVLLVTEIAPDTTGVDTFEFFEVTNTSSTAADLGAEDITLAYTYVDSDDRARDVPSTYPAGTVIPAGSTTVFWLDYSTATVNTSASTIEDFRAHWATASGTAPTDYPVVRITGQPGMANGGDRGVRLSDATSAAWSYYPAGSTAPGLTAHFARSTDAAGSRLLQAQGAPSPGTVLPEAIVDPTPDGPQEPEEPEGPQEPTPGTPQPDPSLVTAPLQVTELLPDSANVGGSDGFEFIEVYNATSAPVDFADYTLRYLYPLEDYTTTQVAYWPSTPRDVTIGAGETLVLWVKNAANAQLGADAFNERFGTALVLGEDLVEVVSAGMANSGARGVEIATNTGAAVNAAYYNMAGADDTTADQGIQYRVDPAMLSRQVLTGQAPATPGRVAAEQVPAGLMIAPADTTAPAITDTTPGSVEQGVDFVITASVTDDAQVRTATLELHDNTSPDVRRINLVAGPDGTFEHTVARADVTGKLWYEYVITATDGTNVASTESRRLEVSGVDTAPLALNLTEGQAVNGSVVISGRGTGYPPGVQLAIDETPVATTSSTLPGQPVFAFEAGGVNTFFRNGVLIGGDELTIFEDGIFEGFETIATPIPLSYVTQGDELVVSIYAGTKAAPEIDLAENNDDFQVKALRLVLPDGRTLRPADYDDPERVLQMGDSAGKLDFVDARFTLPDDAFTAIAHTWDTTTVVDGPHTVTASAGENSVSRTVIVDNTVPEITTSIVEGTEYRGDFLIEADATDAGVGLSSFSTALDGETVKLPYRASSVDLSGGEHVLTLTATDEIGNAVTREVRFITPIEQPVAEPVSPLDGATVQRGQVELSAAVTDPSGDDLDVQFLRGYELTPADGTVSSSTGTTQVAGQIDAGATEGTTAAAMSAEQVAAVAGVDGVDTAVASDTAFPYQLFDVAVPDDAGDDYTARLTWTGSANTGSKVLMYVENRVTGAWEEVDRHIAIDPEEVEFGLRASVPAAGYARDGEISVLVQHSEGFAGLDRSTRETVVVPNHPEDTPRSAYDFTIGWESDTQYYNATFPQRQLDIHDYLLAERDDLNLQYLMHTGDIVDDSKDPQQWLNADPAYRLLDDADLPYGVLAGNHDVNQATNDYTEYSRWFGEARYAGNPWYGGSHLDNRGHFDLITAGGIDLIMVYMGWAPGDAEIAWMNQVLAQYPERKAVLNLHEYMLTTGGLGPIPQRIYDEVVATNPNVMMVASGHYHDAFTRKDAFDDTGDGVPDRTVVQMLFDYQALPEGGQSFLRLLHFDNAGATVTVRTFSPYLQQYNSTDPALELVHQDFVIPYAEVGIAPATKTLSTNAFSAEILTTDTIARVADVASGTSASAEWDAPLGENGWYVTATDEYGATFQSAVSRFTVVETDPAGERQPEPIDPGNGGGNGNGGGGPGTGGGTGTGAGSGTGSGTGTGSGSASGASQGTATGSGTVRDGTAVDRAARTGSSRDALASTGVGTGAPPLTAIAALLLFLGVVGITTVAAARRGRRRDA